MFTSCWNIVSVESFLWDFNGALKDRINKRTTITIIKSPIILDLKVIFLIKTPP